ncbi:hypothetical protein [Nostoc sp.]
MSQSNKGVGEARRRHRTNSLLLMHNTCHAIATTVYFFYSDRTIS